jgi:tripartite ATP-independent transporter DctM subunit
MIIYGLATETSIGRLFIAGIIPGILMAILFAAWVPINMILDTRKKITAGISVPKTEVYTWPERLSITVKIFPFIVIVAMVLGSLYTGWATPSEAAAVGAFLVLLAAIGLYKMYRPKDILNILMRTTRESTMIMMIIATSFLFGAVLTNLYIAQTLAQQIVAMEVNRWIIMFMINVLLLVAGCFLPPVAIILILSPILHPIITGLGFDPIWFGVLMTLNLEAGLITPPVGLNLYIVKGIAPDIPLSTVLRGSYPFILLLFLGMVILCFFPGLATWLPAKMIL